MSILALVLYGSCAREDHDKDSDVDIFALSSEPTYRMIINNKVNIACYPESLASERARSGDLFILHITEEGKPIYDSHSKLQELKSSFRYKENYKKEIQNASDLGWMLINLSGTFSNYTLLNRRIAWCVRTILIAKSAEKKTPKFSATDLCAFASSRYVYALIKNKNNNAFDRNILTAFVEFLNDFGIGLMPKSKMPNITEYHQHFLETGNAIGLKTIAALKNDAIEESYC